MTKLLHMYVTYQIYTYTCKIHIHLISNYVKYAARWTNEWTFKKSINNDKSSQSTKYRLKKWEKKNIYKYLLNISHIVKT